MNHLMLSLLFARPPWWLAVVPLAVITAGCGWAWWRAEIWPGDPEEEPDD